jgi:STE24 endopeptidase
MYDLILLVVLVLPPAVVHLAGHYLSRGFERLTSEQQVKRKQHANWIVGIGMTVQIFGAFLALEQWIDQMPVVVAIGTALLSALADLRDIAGRWVMVAASFAVSMLLVSIDLLLFYRVVFRLDRMAKGIEGNRQAARQQVKLSLRGTLVTMMPVMAWSAAVPILLQSPDASMEGFMLALIAYLFTIYSLSPLMIRLAQPTEVLAPDHPVAVMARELCCTAGVRVSGFRLIRLGETRVANAMVSGLLPWYRCIYVTDHMLETFSPEEIRTILAHEVGHVKKMHLWWYLALGLSGMLVMGQARDGLAILLNMPDSMLPGNLALLLWLGLGFPFFSRVFERQADRYAIALTGDAPSFARALEKLATVNCAPKSSGIGEWFGSHPDIDKRIAAALR